MCLLLVYRNVAGFCVLILYMWFCLTQLLVQVLLSVESWEFSTHIIISSENRESLISSFQNCMLCISFSNFIVLTRNYNAMLKKSGECGQAYRFPTIIQKFFKPLLLSWILAVGFCRWSLPIWGSYLCSYFAELFFGVFLNHDCVLDFIKFFFWVNCYDHMIFHL